MSDLTTDQRSQVDRISADLTEWLLRSSERCVYFSLSHWSSGQQVPVTGKDFPKKTQDRAGHAAEVAVEFATVAVRWAETCEGQQRFLVGGHASTSRTAGAEEQIPFNVQGKEAPREASSGDLALVVGHMQRLVDRTITQLAVTTQEMMDRLKDQNDALLKHQRDMEELHWNVLKQREEALDAKACRDVDMQTKLMSTQMKFKVYNQGLAILWKFIGGVATPTTQKKTNDDSEQKASAGPEQREDSGDKARMLMTAVASLPPEALASFIGQLPESQQQAIQPLIPEFMALMPPEKQAALAEIVMAAVAPTQGGE